MCSRGCRITSLGDVLSDIDLNWNLGFSENGKTVAQSSLFQMVPKVEKYNKWIMLKHSHFSKLLLICFNCQTHLPWKLIYVQSKFIGSCGGSSFNSQSCIYRECLRIFVSTVDSPDPVENFQANDFSERSDFQHITFQQRY